MTSSILKNIISFLLLYQVGACISRYELPNFGAKGFLVVDGHIYVEEGSCTIRLSRSQSLADKSLPIVEFGASVSIESELGNTFRLKDLDSGRYKITKQLFNYEEKYKLKIKTSDGKDYESNFVSTGKTPEIDTISFIEGQFKVRKIKVTTHDPNNSTWYYRWQFEETWDYSSIYKTNYFYDLTIDSLYWSTRNIHICYKSAPSQSILVSSSRKLNSDIIYQFQLQSLDTASKKMDRNYSILVNQVAIREEEYKYWQQLKTTNEATGTLFDPQPSQVSGNIINISDNKEIVLGYFSVYSLASERTTKTSIELNLDWNNQRAFCALDTIDLQYLKAVILHGQDLVYFPPVIAAKECIDCRLAGGDTLKPDYFK